MLITKIARKLDDGKVSCNCNRKEKQDKSGSVMGLRKTPHCLFLVVVVVVESVVVFMCFRSRCSLATKVMVW